MKSKKIINFTIVILSLTASLIFSAVTSEKIDAANESKTSSAVNCEKAFGGNAPESCEQIVYSVARPNNFNNDLVLVNADGSNPVGLLPPEIDGRYPRISPNGRHILFASDQETPSTPDKLYVMRSDGAERVLLSDDAGTLIGASFSPDGTKVAFVRSPLAVGRDDVCVINIDGTGLTVLRQTTRFVSRPAFSPDGTKLIFVESGGGGGPHEMHSINIDGTNLVRLTTAPAFQTVADYAYTPDGSKIVFSSGCSGCGDGDVVEIMNADGTARTRLTNPAVNSFGPRLNPAGDKIVFYGGPLFVAEWDVYMMNLDGTGVVNLSASAERESFPFFTPDGQSIVFSRSLNMMKMNLDGTNIVTLRNDYNNEFGRSLAEIGLFDPDGDEIAGECDNCPLAVNYYRVVFSNGLYIWTMNEDTSGLTRLTFGPTTYRETEPEFNRAGSRIVFQSNRINNRNEIYSMNPDGTDITQLTNIAGGNQQPSYSPDGSKIVFASRRARPGSTNDLYVMNADGSNQVGLGIPGTFATESPTFNHDGTRIVYSAGRLTGPTSSTQDIYTINPDGTNETRLTTATGVDNQPAFSPDGSKIAFVSFRGGDTDGEIYVMNADGTNQTRLTNDTREDRYPTFTPDSRRITFGNRADGHLSTINVDGTGFVRLTSGSNVFYDYLSYTKQPDTDNDGTGDACDPDFSANTPAGDNVAVQAPNGSVSFSNVSQPGVTSFAPITPIQSDLPSGYTLCPTCPAYEITTTAAVTPPITVCLAVPAAVSQSAFMRMSLLHGENGVLVDRTTERLTNGSGQRSVCGVVDSLSPFALAENLVPTAANATLSGRVTDGQSGVRGVSLLLTDTTTGATRSVQTNTFGYYQFDMLETGRLYIVQAQSRKFGFTPASHPVTLLDSVADIDFQTNQGN